VLTLPRDNPSLAGAASASPAPSRPPSMVRIDPDTNEVVREVVDRHLPITREGPLFVVDGVLWQDTLVNMVRRDVETGEAVATIEQPGGSYSGVPAFGSLWFDVVDLADGLALSGSLFHRVDPLSGRVIEVIPIEEPVRGIAAVPTGFVFLTDENVLELDAQVNDIVDTDPHGFDTRPDGIVAVGGNVWICECDEGRISQWDLETDTAVRTIELAQRGLFLEDQRELSQGSVTIDASVVWLMDREAGTITPVDTATGEAGQPVGIPRNSGWHVFGLGSIWIGAGDQIYRFEIETNEATSIPLPAGVTAGGLAADEATGAVWVSNYIPQGEPIPEPLPSGSSGAPDEP